MVKEFLKYIERRRSQEPAHIKFPNILYKDSAQQIRFTEEGFFALSDFLEKGDTSYQNLAVQAAMRWSASSQKVGVRNILKKRGFITPSCLWAYMKMRGAPEDILQEFSYPEMSLMQIILLKEVEPDISAPFLIERFLYNKDAPEELRAASRLSLLRLMDAGIDPKLIDILKSRYPTLEILEQWRPKLATQPIPRNRGILDGKIDFYQLVRSIQGVRELSSLSRIVYLISSFYVPLSDKEWASLWLSGTDQLFFRRLISAAILDRTDDGYVLCADATKQAMVKRFLYESYPLVKETISRNHSARIKEERELKVRTTELDRQALEMLSDGIICVSNSGSLYYMNPAAEKLLSENQGLKKKLLGAAPIEEALKRYSKESMIARLKESCFGDDQVNIEIFGAGGSITVGQKKFNFEFGRQTIIIRDITNQYLIDKEIGALYRHEVKAALDVMGLGIAAASEMAGENNHDGLKECLFELEQKRSQLYELMEEKLDFIRLHSDSFRVSNSPVNLNMVIDKCVSNYKEAASAKKVIIKSDHLHVEGLYIQGEDRFIIKAIDNILRNAVKFSHKKSEIRIKLSRESRNALIEIQDNGPGIPKENLGRIFQLGFTTTGSGRGLYLAKRIVTAHGGRIEVKSKRGSGACFTIKLPLNPEN